MVTPLEVKIVKSIPGEVELPEVNIVMTYTIIGVKAAKVGGGYSVAATIDITAKFIKTPGRILGVCAPGNVPYRSVPFAASKLAHAVIETDGRVFDIYVEPIAVMVADGFITPLGEPCIAVSTATGWVARQPSQDTR
ncbi:MAG: hypothetical protein QXS00_04890 [Pyrobaculum sp.]|uniref:hypothetical protein n=1 Tax=Pyrobaculum sp. TaxID=2004705 RepID=UPI00315F1EF2